MFGLSQQTADAVFGFSNITLVVGAALVLLGTIGVFWSGGIRERFSDERISVNETKTALANENAANANANAAQANERAAQAERKTAELKKDAEQAHLQAEKLKAQLAWRTLSTEDSNNLVRNLSIKSGSAIIGYVANDPEAQAFAIQIANLFDAAHWKVGIASSTFTNTFISGIFIPNGSSADIDSARAAFGKSGVAFSNDSLPPAIMQSGNMNASWAQIFIGSKSPPK